MVFTQRRVTAEEFLALPFEPNLQLIDGEIVRNQPVLRHQRIVGELHRLLANWLLANPGHGEAGMGCDVLLDEYNVFVPDVWLVNDAHRLGRDAELFEGPPDLVAEVRSPSTWSYDMGKKKSAYERAGLGELWLLDTETDTVLVFRGSDAHVVAAGGKLTTPLLPGLGIDVAALFDR